MCGIAGLLSPGQDDADGISAILQKMTRSLAHRGPDAEGYWTEGGWRLGIDASPFWTFRTQARSPCDQKVGVKSSYSMARSTTTSICVVTSQQTGRHLIGAGTPILRPSLLALRIGGSKRRFSAQKACLRWHFGTAQKSGSLWRGTGWGKSRSTGGGLGRRWCSGLNLRHCVRIQIARVMCAATHWRNICALCMYPPRAAFILASTNWNQGPSSRLMVRRLPVLLRTDPPWRASWQH